jgi:hypothetical protein
MISWYDSTRPTSLVVELVLVRRTCVHNNNSIADEPKKIRNIHTYIQIFDYPFWELKYSNKNPSVIIAPTVLGSFLLADRELASTVVVVALLVGLYSAEYQYCRSYSLHGTCTTCLYE